MEYEILKKYNMENSKIWKENNYYYVKYNNRLFILKRISEKTKDYLEHNYIHQSYYQLILNNNHSYVTKFHNGYYVLFYIDSRQEIEEGEIIEVIYSNQLTSVNWIEHWKRKIDYLEAILKHDKREIVNETKDYFFGLSETAINILNYNKEKLITNISLCRRRINLNIYRHPDNAIIDTKERDIGEYIKYMIFMKEESHQNIIKFLDKAKKSGYNNYLLASRILFPTYYFDIIEENINEDTLNKVIKKIINKIPLLESVVDYLLMNKIEINWIKKQE